MLGRCNTVDLGVIPSSVGSVCGSIHPSISLFAHPVVCPGFRLSVQRFVQQSVDHAVGPSLNPLLVPSLDTLLVLSIALSIPRSVPLSVAWSTSSFKEKT